MTKQTNFGILLPAILFAASVFLLAVDAKAQTASKVFKVGERIDVNVANDIENEDRWIKGTVTEVLYTDDGRILSYKVKRDPTPGGDAGYVQQFLNRPRVIRPASSGGDAVNTTPVKQEPGLTSHASTQSASARSAAPASAAVKQSTAPGTVVAKAYHCVYFSANHLVTTAGITITGGSTYTDRDGKAGTYTLDAASSTLTFHGGNYDGQQAEYEVKDGRPLLHILGPSGRRVIDCD